MTEWLWSIMGLIPMRVDMFARMGPEGLAGLLANKGSAGVTTDVNFAESVACR